MSIVKRFVGLLVVIVVTTLGMALFTSTVEDAHGNRVSTTQVMGVPVLRINASTDDVESPAIVSVGGPGVGVLYVGVAGAGVVAMGAGGAGVLFGLGQLATGLLSIGQISIGLVFALGQLAIGSASLGQLAVGWRTRGQGSESRDGWRFIKSLNAELEEALKFDWRGRK